MAANNIEEELQSPISDWNPIHVGAWLRKAEPELEEARLFEESEISGKALYMIDRQLLKELGITPIGKQVVILGLIKELRDGKDRKPMLNSSPSTSGGSEQPMKLKISRADKKEMTQEQRRIYQSKIKMIRKECMKRWSGNKKIYFKSDNSNALILSELVSSLAPMCSVEQIGFGQTAIRSHILQWVSERNRRITDGYDFEKPRIPAKRAKHYSGISSDEELCLSQQIAPTDAEKPQASDNGELYKPSTVEDISQYSSQLICSVAFNVPVFRNLSVKQHLIPAGKVLGVKGRGLGKYEIAVKIVTQLVKQQYVTISEDADFFELSREQIRSSKDLLEEVANLSPHSGSSTTASVSSDSPSMETDFDDMSSNTNSD